MIGTVGGVARSFEITNCDGSSPCAIMACSTSGSLRMNSAENPPTVDCSVIDTASPQANASRPNMARSALPVLLGGPAPWVQAISAGGRARHNIALKGRGIMTEFTVNPTRHDPYKN